MKDSNTMNTALLTAGAAFLAATLTKITDLFRNTLDPNDDFPKWVWNVVPLALGVAAALIWQIDAVGQAWGATTGTRLQGIAGQVITGLAIGGGSAFFHELFDNLSSGAKAKQKQAE